MRRSGDAAVYPFFEMRRSSGFFPFFTRAAIQSGMRPRPVHVSERFSGLRYFGLTLRPAKALLSVRPRRPSNAIFMSSGPRRYLTRTARSCRILISPLEFLCLSLELANLAFDDFQ